VFQNRKKTQIASPALACGRTHDKPTGGAPWYENRTSVGLSIAPEAGWSFGEKAVAEASLSSRFDFPRDRRLREMKPL
jgi:hypothetical protein